jgi:hypothetical protein
LLEAVDELTYASGFFPGEQAGHAIHAFLEALQNGAIETQVASRDTVQDGLHPLTEGLHIHQADSTGCPLERMHFPECGLDDLMGLVRRQTAIQCQEMCRQGLKMLLGF